MKANHFPKMRTLLADWWNICSALILSKYLWPITPLRLRCFRFRKGYESFSLLFRQFATVEFRFWMLCDLVRSMHGMNVLYWLIDLCSTLTFSPNRYSDQRNTSKTERTKNIQLSARVSPAWGEWLTLGEKREERNELERRLHAFSHIACLLLSCFEAWILSWRLLKRKCTNCHYNSDKNQETFWSEMATLLQCGGAIVEICTTALLSHKHISASYLSLCLSLVVGFEVVLVADCEVVFHSCVDTTGLSSCPICQFFTLTNTYLLLLLYCVYHTNSTWNKKLDCFLVSPWGWTSLFYYILFSLGWLSCRTMSYCVVLRSCGYDCALTWLPLNFTIQSHPTPVLQWLQPI